MARRLLDESALREVLERGFALIRRAISPQLAVRLRGLYDEDAIFRSRIVMERHSFGRGEYKYFANPLPAPIRALREQMYAELVPTANEWMRRLRRDASFPASHQEFLGDCLAAEQQRPTALLLRYRSGDYNRLHQDLYGPVAFPLQATVYLSRPGDEFAGGEVVLAEQKPRSQTRVHVLTPEQGDVLILPTSSVPIAGSSGYYRAMFRHGVSTVTRGERFTLGLVLHDAL